MVDIVILWAGISWKQGCELLSYINWSKCHATEPLDKQNIWSKIFLVERLADWWKLPICFCPEVTLCGWWDVQIWELTKNLFIFRFWHVSCVLHHQPSTGLQRMSFTTTWTSHPTWPFLPTQQGHCPHQLYWCSTSIIQSRQSASFCSSWDIFW